MELLALGIAVVVGIIIGVLVYRSRMSAKTMEWLRIDHSEPDEPTRMFVELRGVTPDMIAQYKFVQFEVINESYISRN